MAKKSANRSPKDLNDMPSEEFCDWLFKKLESDDDLLPADFSNMVDEEMRHDAPGRVALVFLSKPWKQMSDSMVKDRDTALAFAEIAVRLDESIGLFIYLIFIIFILVLLKFFVLCILKKWNPNR